MGEAHDVAGDRLPVLALYGPGGVGKTTVAWRLFDALSRSGVPVGLVDNDAVAMCYGPPTPDAWAPEPVADPGRFRMRARNLDAVVPNFRAAGARCLIAPGVVDAARGVDAALMPRAALTVCRLRADPEELLRRLTRRGRPSDRPDDVLRYAGELDRHGRADICVDTTGRGVDEVVALVREGCDGRLDGTGPAASWTPPDRGTVRTPGAILWLCGARAVGTSTVGWELYQRVRRAGHRAAFVDLSQLGFHRPVPAEDPGNHRLKAANLAAVWRTYRTSGATCLIVVGTVDRPEDVPGYRSALPAAAITVCRLHAAPGTLAARVRLRADGVCPTWGLAGEDLTGRPPEEVRAIAERAAAQALHLDRAGVGDLRVETDDRQPSEIVEEILRRTGWPPT